VVPTSLPTVIATRDIPLGVTITQDMLATQDLKVDTERITNAYQSDKLVLGQVARRKIGANAQITPDYFDTSTTGCGTVEVPAGLRAISVQVDQVSGVGTIINAGDFVDLLVGFTGDRFPVVSLDPQTNAITTVAGLNGTSVKLLTEGMQVLCRQLPPVAAPANGQAPPAQGTNTSTTGGTQTSLNGQQEIVIVAATPTQAELIKFSQLDGSISMVLRSTADFQRDPATGEVIPPAPSGSEGITLKKLTTDFAVPIPELVEAILPAQPKP
jgi:Flp pilus assembly protein CpaB